MIRYNKTLNMSIGYKEKSASKNSKYKDLNMKVETSLEKNEMEIILPDGKSIVVNAEWLKVACEKAILLHQI